jgi:dihydrolipoamide dehydrogenase
MNQQDVDVAIIGAGSAGLAALREVRKRTDRFVLIDPGPLGTTCARVGCMPSKLLIEAANAFHRRHAFETFGIHGAASLSVNLPAVLRRLREMRDGFVADVVRVNEGLGERLVEGHARLLGPEFVEAAGRRFRARRIIVATGSRPLVPPSWKLPPGTLLTTDDLFEQETLPARLAVIGMGPIGSELAQAMSRLGIGVTGFGARGRVAGLSDPVVNEALVGALREEFRVYLGAQAAPRMEGDRLLVASGEHEVEVDCVLAALGRRPNLESLGLDRLGLKLDDKGMPPVDPHTMQIGDLPIYLAGDANGQRPILHEAADEGHIAGLRADGEAGPTVRRRVPLGIVFCAPTAAAVGKRFEELERAQTLIGQVDFATQGRARAAQRDRGLLRVYAARESGKLLGAEMCAPSGEHLAHLLALAVERSLTVQELLRMPFYHPVLEEGLRTALRELAGQLPRCGESDLAACEPIGAQALG